MSEARVSVEEKKYVKEKIYMANRLPTLHKETPLKVNTISLVQLLTTFFATIIAPAVFAVDSF